MAVICRDKKLLFILNPRTGSSALGDHLIKEFGGEWLPKETIYINDNQIKIEPKHNTIQKLLDFDLITSKELSEYLVFTSVANPYDSLLTLYNKYRYRYDEWRKEGRPFLQNTHAEKEIDFCKNHSINQWVFSRYFKSAIKSILGLEKFSINEQYLDGCKIILKKESMQEDFDKMLSKERLKGNNIIPIINKTEKKEKDKQDLSIFSRLLIYFTYKSDFKNFNYPF